MARTTNEADGSIGRRSGARPVADDDGVPADRQPGTRCTPDSPWPSSSTTACRSPARSPSPAAGAYLALGRDLIPDDIPILGGIDDLIVLVLAVELFFDGVPDDLLHEKLDELGIERLAFEQDLAQIRRLTPGPVRRTIRRVPVLVGDARRAVDAIGLGPRIRVWINKEESIA